MAFEISIDEVAATASKDIREGVRRWLEKLKERVEGIQESLKDGTPTKIKIKDSYGNYFPGLFPAPEGSPASRLVSHILGHVWEYCCEEGIPELNFLVVLQDLKNPNGLGFPSNGVVEWYADHFDTLLGFETYCHLQAKLAEEMLIQGAIVLVPCHLPLFLLNVPLNSPGNGRLLFPSQNIHALRKEFLCLPRKS